MHKKNLKEYEIVRNEMNQIKSGIHRYLGFVIGFSGVAFTGYVTIVDLEKYNIIAGLICFFASATISIFLSILMYKFNSHNRYAGYLRLLNQEINHKSTGKKKDKEINEIILWELCIGKLENCQKIDNFPEGYYKKLRYKKNIDYDMAKDRFEDYKEVSPGIDEKNLSKNFISKLFRLKELRKSKSWKYPIEISIILYYLIFFFLGLGLIQFIFNFTHNYDENIVYFSTDRIVSIAISMAMLIYIILIIRKSINDLYKLMDGSKMVSAYCWKFFPFRIYLLNKFGIKPSYIQIEKN